MTPNRICFIGDSITVGYADEDGLGWPARLCQGLMIGTRPVTCYNLGINGDTSRDVAQRWRSEIEARSRDGGPGLLVFAFGFNDAATRVGEGQQIALGTSSDIARAVIGEAQTLAPVLWIGPTPCNENINPMTDAGVTWEMWERRYCRIQPNLCRHRGGTRCAIYRLDAHACRRWTLHGVTCRGRRHASGVGWLCANCRNRRRLERLARSNQLSGFGTNSNARHASPRLMSGVMR